MGDFGVNIKGQILPEINFGKVLTELAAQADVIVEIGTWHGQGSTRCLAMGLVRPEQRIWSVEPDEACWREASEIWKHETRITFVNKHALNALDQLPSHIDLLLLDGDDLTSFEEFKALAPRCKWIALDDTKEVKNKQSREFALEMGWGVLKDQLDERLGWAIFETNYHHG